MTTFKQVTQDFETSPVPDSDTVSGWQISVVKIGGVIALPAFLTGAELGAKLGLVHAFYSMALGAFILAIVAALTGSVAAQSRLSTSMITQFSFGRLGSRAVNAVLVVTMVGWFGVTASLFGVTLRNVMSNVAGLTSGVITYTILGSVLMITTTIFGFKALKRLSDFAVPVLFLFLVIVDVLAARRSSLTEVIAYRGTGLPFGLAVSAVVGGLIVGATVFPDMCRFARSSGDGRLAAALGFAVAIPVVLMMASFPSIATGQRDLMVIMANLGAGIPALCVIVFAAWTTNSANLYSSSLGLSVIFGRVARWKLCIVAGVVGTAFAVSGIADYFIPFLLLLGITIPPIAGIYVADFFIVRGQKFAMEDLAVLPTYSIPAFAAWFLAATFAYITSKGILTATGVPALDSAITAFFVYALIMRVWEGAMRWRARDSASS
jgi:cytosine permease